MDKRVYVAILAFHWKNCESPKYLGEEYSRWIKAFHFVKSCKFKIHIVNFTLTIVKINFFIETLI